MLDGAFLDEIIGTLKHHDDSLALAELETRA